MVAAAAVAASLFLCWSTPVAAQDEPIIIGLKREVPKFQIQRPEVVLDLLTRYSTDSIDPAEGAGAESSQTVFRETLSASTNAYILSPNFLDINLAGTFGLSQSRSDFSGSAITPDGSRSASGGTESGTIHEFDVSATFLRLGPAPVTAYARRSVDLVNRTFAGSLESINETYGADVNIRTELLPTTLRLYHTAQEQVTLDGAEDFSFEQNTFEWRSEKRFGENDNQNLTWDYRFSDLTQTTGRAADPFGPAFDLETVYQTHDAQLNHTYNFGERNRHSLRSTLSYYQQTGDFEQERLSVFEQLNLRHTDRFETFYTYQFNDFTFLDTQQSQHRGTAGFRHRLYQSLVSSGVAGVSLLDFEESQTTEQFANLSLDYTKKVPLGRFGAGISGAYNLQQNDARSEPILVLDELRSFTDGAPIILSRRSINPASVRLTDAAGIRLFQRGLDYVVSSFPDRVEIRRVPGGAIPANSNTLVDYTINPEPATDITTTSFGLGVRYDMNEGWLRGLGVYARYLLQDQSIDGGEGILVEDDVTDFTFGADYRIWKLILSAEQQIRDSTVSPYTRTQLEAQYIDQFGDNTLFSLSASHSITDYEPGENVSAGDVLLGEEVRSELTLVTAQLEHRFTRELYGTASVIWLSQNDSFLGGETIGFEQNVALRWRHRQTEVYGIVRHNTLETDTQDSEFFIFQVGLTRRF